MRWRSLRQDGEAARARLSRGPAVEAAAARRREALRAAAADAGPAGAAFLLRRSEDGRAPSGASRCAAERPGHRRSCAVSRRPSPTASPTACGADATSPARLGDNARPLVVAGGVAANQRLRARSPTSAGDGYTLHVPPFALCTDNAAMVAWAGAERLARGLDARRAIARPLAARPRRGSGPWRRASRLKQIWIWAYAAMTAAASFLYDRPQQQWRPGHGFAKRRYCRGRRLGDGACRERAPRRPRRDPVGL